MRTETTQPPATAARADQRSPHWLRRWVRQQLNMTQEQQISAFSNELDTLVNKYAAEFDLNSAAVCGILLMKIRLIQDAAMKQNSENGE